jgi:hypothetical protein
MSPNLYENVSVSHFDSNREKKLSEFFKLNLFVFVPDGKMSAFRILLRTEEKCKRNWRSLVRTHQELLGIKIWVFQRVCRVNFLFERGKNCCVLFL